MKVASSSVICGPVPVMSMAIIWPPRARPVRLAGIDSVPLSSSMVGPLIRTDRSAEAVAVARRGVDDPALQRNAMVAVDDEERGSKQDEEEANNRKRAGSSVAWFASGASWTPIASAHAT
ncbi:MAG: hypothetical protein WDN31_14265 [Hyphomicrobium sp.]